MRVDNEENRVEGKDGWDKFSEEIVTLRVAMKFDTVLSIRQLKTWEASL